MPLFRPYDQGAPPDAMHKLRCAQAKLSRSARRRLDKLKKDKHCSSLSQSLASTVVFDSSFDLAYSSIEMDELDDINAVKPAAKAALDQHQLPDSDSTSEEIEYDIKMEIDLDLPQGRRHIFLSLFLMPMEKAAYNHTVNWG